VQHENIIYLGVGARSFLSKEVISEIERP